MQPITNEESELLFSKLASLLYKKSDVGTQKIQNRMKGYTRDDIERIINNPEGYQNQLVDLSNYMYRHSGYYQRLIDYFSDMGLFNWRLDCDVYDERYIKDTKKANKNYMICTGNISRLNIEFELNEILKRVFLEDAYFGYLVEDDNQAWLYHLPTSWCAVRNVLQGRLLYGINPKAVSPQEKILLPKELQKLLDEKTTAEDPYVYPLPEKNFLIKFNSHLTYIYPPFFNLIKNIMDIEDYKDLVKTKTESENYNLLSLKIPIDSKQADTLLLTNKTVIPFYNMIRNIMPDEFGTIVSPFDIEPIQFKMSTTSERDKVRDAISNFYDEAGVSKDLLSSSGTGSELKISMENDATEIYKLYRQIEKFINFKIQHWGLSTPTYKYIFKLYDVTSYNKKDNVELELKLATDSYPVKSDVLAKNGKSINRLLGSDFIENRVLNSGNGIDESWKPLKISSTQGKESTSSGKPTNESQGIPLTDAGVQTQEGNTNDSANRV